MQSLKRKRSLDAGSERGMKLVRESLEGGVSEGKDANRRKSLESASQADIETFIIGIRRPSVDSGLISFDQFEAAKFLGRENLVRDSQQTALSAEDFKSRLATFDIRRWSRKPDCIASFHCARFGWKLCDQGDALVCVTCKQLIPISGDGNAFATSSLALRCETQLRQAIETTCHASYCPWKKYFSPVTILCLPQGFEMYSFLKDGVASFDQTFTHPKLHSHYGQIMGNLDLTWMKCIVGLKSSGLIEKSGDILNEEISPQLICFLVLCGWSMKATNLDDGIGCNLCLREIPLWICNTSALEADIVCCESSEKRPVKSGGRKYSTELDPVNNHWWWCPWRRFLEFSDAATIVSNNVVKDMKNVDFFEQRFEDSLCLKPHADKDDYLRLKLLIEQECSQAASINEIQVISPQVVSTVGSIMDEFVSPSRRTAFRSLSNESLLSPTKEGGEAIPDQSNSNSNSMLEPPRVLLSKLS